MSTCNIPRRLAMLLVLALGQAAQAGLQVERLSVDHLVNPLGLDSSAPRLSWQLTSDLPATLQTAYELVVTDVASGATVWSSGRVNSDQSLLIDYAGAPLTPRTRYQWQVKVWDNHGQASAWSDPAYWETGLLDPASWSAQWITYPWQEDTSESGPSPMLRREFGLSCTPVSGRLYITALGLYEAHINGKRVGDAWFTPGWTSYDKRLQYQVYDVSSALQAGQNAIGIRLGDGWYRGFMSWEMQRNRYGDRLAARAQLRVHCADGSEHVLDSDEQWQAATGAITAADIYNGESQDLRLAQTGWSGPGFVHGEWQPVTLFKGATPPLVDSRSAPVRVIQTVKPVALLKGPDGETIVDMGQNLVGWVRLQAQGEAGDTIVLRHAEVLDQSGALYTRALRAAQQTNRYTLADSSAQILQPHFTFQGFRYVSVEGYPGELTLDKLQGVVVSSDLAQTGQFSSSDAMLNQLQSNILWGQRGNFLDVPTDCPQRDERMGWTGDTQVFARTALYNTDSAAFFNKWLADARADQYDNGGIPFVVPDVLSKLSPVSVASLFMRLGNASSGWGDAITEVPMAVYERRGDVKTLQENYASMRRWVEYQRASADSWWYRLLDVDTWFDSAYRADDRYIWNGTFTFGDWLAPVQASETYINTVYFARSVKLLADSAVILGHIEDAEHYQRLLQQITAAFQHRFYAGQGKLREQGQGAYVLALQFDLLPPDQAPLAAAQLNALIQADDYHLATGFLSTPYLLPVLTRYGYLATAYKVLQQQTYPSWLYPITKGATTIWERWGSIQPDGSFGDDGMNSFNHYAYGAVGDWMYQTIGGIRPLQPGYKAIQIAPRPGGSLTHASTEYDSPYGRISSNWRLDHGRLSLDVQIPANTTAEIIFPGRGEVSVNPSATTPVAAGVVRHRDDQTVIQLGSGQYTINGRFIETMH